MPNKPLKFVIVAGEASGDVLAAGLIKYIRKQHPDAVFEGIAGSNMIEHGCKTWFDLEELSVMGLVEVLSRIRRLLFIRKTVVQNVLSDPPDAYIGVDAPDFNLPIEKKLKQQGIKTVHYVSPTVWAWRENRIFGIGAATDMVLSIFPFEKQVYDKHGFACRFVGHTMADDIPLVPNKHAARQQLELAESAAPVLAILPGSRASEVNMLLQIFLQSAAKICQQLGVLKVVIPAVNEHRKLQIEGIVEDFHNAMGGPSGLDVSVLLGQSRQAMIAADAILLASGTASLEAMLCKRPMVVAYRLKWLTHQMMKKLYKAKYFSLPNLLADEAIVPELLQQDVNPETISQLMIPMLEQSDKPVTEAFTQLHLQLRQNADKQAAQAVLQLIGVPADD